MNANFSRMLSLLRQEKKVSQRTAARELGISQALLSHYENGVREPGLEFVSHACDYYNVSADFVLGRTLSREGAAINAETLYDYSAEKDNVLRGSVMATLSKKLLVNSVSMLFELLGKVGNKSAITAAADYLSSAVYTVFRHLYRANTTNNEDFFSVSSGHFITGLAKADMIYSEVDYIDALSRHGKEKGEFPDLSNEALMRNYPGSYQSLLQIVHSTGERINRRINTDKEKETGTSQG
jgi:transcriptional regulator with XRE-family HTH domain